MWCPVTDLVKWHEHTATTGRAYARHIEACTGGTPEERGEEYARRSPSTHPERLTSLPVSIHHGRHDPVVPFRHSVELARRIEEAGSDRIFLDVFDGGHEQLPHHSFEHFAKLAGKNAAAVGITG